MGDRTRFIDEQLARARELPTTKRVHAKLRATIEEAERRHESGVMTWSIDTPGRAPLVPMIAKRAHGCYLQDLDDNEHVDLHMGVWTAILGHSPPVVVEALTRELANGMTIGVGHDHERALCELLARNVACAEVICLANSGTEALMHAIKASRASRRRHKIAKFATHYHGHYDELVSDLKDFSAGRGRADDTLVLPHSSEAFAQIRAAADELACVIIEPGAPARDIRRRYDLAFFEELRRLTHELGIVLVFDEVFRGFRSRFGPTLDAKGVVPDLICLGKICGGGLPLACLAGRRSIMDAVRTTGNVARDHETRVPLMGTYSGNRLACVAAVAQLTYLEAHQHEVYPFIATQAATLAEQINVHAARRSLPIEASTSEGGLIGVHRHSGADPSPIAGTPTDPVVLLQTYVREHDVYFNGLHVQMSMAHRPEIVSRTSDAFGKAMDALVADGV